MKKGTIIWIIILIALWAAWSRYYIKNNWEKVVNEDWTIVEYTLKRWKMEWKWKATYPDWQIREKNYKNWVEEWEEIWYYPNWNIQYKAIRKEWKRDRTKEAIIYYENWSYRRISTPDWLNIGYYENWQIEDEYNENSDGDIIWIRKWYNEEWELIAEWEYKDWKKYNWTFVYKIQWYDVNDEYYKTIYIEEYKEWELIDKQLYDN